MSIVCVMGRRFSGSTILGRILDASPDVFCVGETLSLSHNHASCAACGGKCKVLNYRFLSKVPPMALYEQILIASGKKVLVTTDKPFHYIDRVTMEGAFCAVFVFKKLYAFAASEKRGHSKHKSKDGSPIFTPLPVDLAMEGFCDYYEKALRWSRPSKKIFVSLEHLIEDHAIMTRKLFDSIGIRHPKGAIDISRLTHHFALGNYDAMSSRALEVDRRWVEELTDEEKGVISSHRRARRVYRRLLVCSLIGRP